MLAQSSECGSGQVDGTAHRAGRVPLGQGGVMHAFAFLIGHRFPNVVSSPESPQNQHVGSGNETEGDDEMSHEIHDRIVYVDVPRIVSESTFESALIGLVLEEADKIIANRGYENGNLDSLSSVHCRIPLSHERLANGEVALATDDAAGPYAGGLCYHVQLVDLKEKEVSCSLGRPQPDVSRRIHTPKTIMVYKRSTNRL